MITSCYLWWLYELTQSPDADQVISKPQTTLVILVILLAGVMYQNLSIVLLCECVHR